MIVYRRVIRVQDTDATGVLYFANLLQIALEAFEDFLHNSKFSLHSMIEAKDFLLPIVHVEADFFAPIFVADLLDVQLSLKAKGNSSFTLASEFFKKGEKVGRAEIVHVCCSQETKKAIPPPPELQRLLSRI
jgi:1,4-dihydroxy-2-naphthoyl-CoA hydrolase